MDHWDRLNYSFIAPVNFTIYVANNIRMVKMKKFRVLMMLLLSLCITGAASASDRFAFVTSEDDNNLTILDLNTEKVVKTLPTGKTPHVVAFTSAGRGYVSNRGSRDLTVIDGNTFSVIKTIPLPATSFQLALSPDGNTLAVAYKDALEITLINTATDAVMRTIAVGKRPEGGFRGAMMRHAYWSSDGAYVYASDDVNDSIVKIDIKTGEIKASISLPGPTHYIHPSEAGKLLYAVNEGKKQGGTSITVIDALRDKVVKDIPIPLEPGERGSLHHGEFSKDGKYFFVCNEGGWTVSIMDTAKLEIMKTVSVGLGAGHPARTKDGRYFFIIEHRNNFVSVMDIAKQEIVKSIAVGTGKKQAHASYFTPDGKYFYMVNAEDSMMNKIDVSTMQVVSRIPVGKTAMFFAIKEGKEFPGTE
jgi:YVTN family beta-propeller protein